MKTRTWLVFVMLFLTANIRAGTAQEAAFLLTFGRAPSTSETAGANALPETIASYRQRLANDPALAASARAQAWRDSFGTEPSADRSKSTENALTYVEHMKANLATIGASSDVQRKVINRAYRYLFNREAYDSEYTYWQTRPAAPFLVIVGCLDAWGRRNQPGLMVTSGAPVLSHTCRFLRSVTVDRNAAHDLREALGLATEDAFELASARAHNLVGLGAETAVSQGSIFFAAIGAWDNPLPTNN